MSIRNWLLPEYIEDVLPPEAQRIEALRRRILDLFRSHGYQLVIPPLVEYLESLLTGSGSDLDLNTFKLVDQLSGRLMGLRADITPQVARIDAHLLNRQGITRLCYIGNILHVQPIGLARSRESLQIGAEIYGHATIESDIEIQRLMLDALRLSGVENIQMGVGHVGIFRALNQKGGVALELESELFEALQTKDESRLAELVAPLTHEIRDAFISLPRLYGNAEIINQARDCLPKIPEIGFALDQLETIAKALSASAEIRFDLAELRGYHYHSGVVFAAYTRGAADAIARGGRYDEVGKAFGRARPATGFSMDLREISRLLPVATTAKAILAPYSDDRLLQQTIAELRRQGESVVVDLPGHENSRRELDCDRILVEKKGAWHVNKI